MSEHHRTEAHDTAPCEDRAEWRETDEWVNPTDLREPQAATMPPMRGDGGEKP